MTENERRRAEINSIMKIAGKKEEPNKEPEKAKEEPKKEPKKAAKKKESR